MPPPPLTSPQWKNMCVVDLSWNFNECLYAFVGFILVIAFVQVFDIFSIFQRRLYLIFKLNHARHFIFRSYLKQIRYWYEIQRNSEKNFWNFAWVQLKTGETSLFVRSRFPNLQSAWTLKRPIHKVVGVFAHSNRVIDVIPFFYILKVWFWLQTWKIQGRNWKKISLLINNMLASIRLYTFSLLINNTLT